MLPYKIECFIGFSPNEPLEVGALYDSVEASEVLLLWSIEANAGQDHYVDCHIFLVTLVAHNQFLFTATQLLLIGHFLEDLFEDKGRVVHDYSAQGLPVGVIWMLIEKLTNDKRYLAWIVPYSWLELILLLRNLHNVLERKHSLLV